MSKRQSNDSSGSMELDVDNTGGGGGGGDATAANQVIGNASLASIDGKLTSPVTVTATDLDIRNLLFASDKVDVSGSSVSVSNFPSGGATAAKQDTGNASLASIDGKLANPLPVTGPLTDVQLRASAVVVTGTVATGGLTDTQLRATPVPVSGPLTDTQLRATNVPVSAAFATFKADVSGSTGLGVTGTFWQATQPVSAASLPLPTGASTEATLALIKAKTDNIDVALSTRTKPADQQHVIVDSSALPTGAATLTEQQTQTASLSVLDDWDETDRAKVNLIAGQAGITGAAGTVAANTPRVTLGSNDPAVTALQIMDDWDESDRAKVNPIVGQAGVAAGSGTNGVTVQRVTVATDDAILAIPTTIFNGKKTVTTAGTRVTLAASQSVKSVTIKALAANTGTIYVGDSSVASTNGFQLAAGDSISMDIANLNTINLDSSVNGEGVSYIAVL